MRITLQEIDQLFEREPALSRHGCVVDTNVIFAAQVPSDHLNQWAEDLFIKLESLELSVHTNINIRYEFIDLQRRVMIPEGLSAFYEDSDKETMNLHLKTQLRSLKTQMERAKNEKRAFKASDYHIKTFRKLFDAGSQHGWELFCRDFLNAYLTVTWDQAISDLNIQFVGTSDIEKRENFDQDPEWEDMVKIMGRFGIGSADAMIINFFLSSKFPLIVTGDEDVAYAVERLSAERQANGKKYVLVPKKEEDPLQ